MFATVLGLAGAPVLIRVESLVATFVELGLDVPSVVGLKGVPVLPA